MTAWALISALITNLWLFQGVLNLTHKSFNLHENEPDKFGYRRQCSMLGFMNERLSNRDTIMRMSRMLQKWRIYETATIAMSLSVRYDGGGPKYLGDLLTGVDDNGVAFTSGLWSVNPQNNTLLNNVLRLQNDDYVYIWLVLTYNPNHS